MRKSIFNRSIMLVMSAVLILGLSSCGHKKASKGADSVRKKQKEIKWDKGELSENHKKQSRTVSWTSCPTFMYSCFTSSTALWMSWSIDMSWRLNSSAARLSCDITCPILRAADGRFFGPTTMRMTASSTSHSPPPTDSKRNANAICP